MIIRGSKMSGSGFLFNFETGVVQGLTDDGTLEVIEAISLLSSQSDGLVNSPLNPESPFNPVNFVDTGENDNDEPDPTIYSYLRISPQTTIDWEPGVDPNSTEEGNEGAENNSGDGENNDGSGDNSGNEIDGGHHSNGTQGPNGEDYFNPESEQEVPLVLGSDQPNNMVKGQTWLTFDEYGQGIISVYNGQEWSKVGEELQPLDIGSY